MNRLKKYIFTISFSLLFLIPGQAQNIDLTYRYANKQMYTGNYDNAIAAYRRVLFFDSTNHYDNRAYFQVAECYKETGELNKAHYFFDLAYNTARNDSLKNEVTLNKTYLYILQRQAGFAMMELASMGDSLNTHFRKEKQFYNGIIQFREENFEQSKQHFQEALMTKGKSSTHKLDTLYEELKDVNKLNPKLARYLSLFLPGLGQLYAGYPKEAINSFLLSAGSWGLYFYTLQQYTLLDAILSIYPWFHRYYLGGHYRAGDLLKKKKKKQRNQALTEILQLFKK